MAKGLKIEVLGLKETSRFLKGKGKQAMKLAGDGTEKAGVFIQGEVKESIAGRKAEPRSVDTGRLLNSVGVKFAGLRSEVFTSLGYAKFLEFGTTKITARKHFSNSAARNKSEVKKIIQKEVNRI